MLEICLITLHNPIKHIITNVEDLSSFQSYGLTSNAIYLLWWFLILNEFLITGKRKNLTFSNYEKEFFQTHRKYPGFTSVIKEYITGYFRTRKYGYNEE